MSDQHDDRQGVGPFPFRSERETVQERWERLLEGYAEGGEEGFDRVWHEVMRKHRTDDEEPPDSVPKP